MGIKITEMGEGEDLKGEMKTMTPKKKGYGKFFKERKWK